jgi:hypothetical protein
VHALEVQEGMLMEIAYRYNNHQLDLTPHSVHHQDKAVEVGNLRQFNN